MGSGRRPNMMRSAALAAALAFLSTPSLAAHWNVDYGKSRLGFQVNWGGAPFVAVFKSWKAEIDFDPADLTHARAQVTIDIASEASDDSETDGGLRSEQGFAAAQFPTARFQASSFRHTGGNQYVASGSLSIKGISRPITLPFLLVLSGNSAHVAGKAQLLRTDFNLGTGEWAKADPVAHAVTVNLDLVATKT
jgi:polyisoprenoid-binding protein YceI